MFVPSVPVLGSSGHPFPWHPFPVHLFRSVRSVRSVRSRPKLSKSARNDPKLPAKIIKKMLNRFCFSFHLLAKTALQVKSGQIPVPKPSKTPVSPCFNYSLNRCFTNSCFAVVRYPYQIVQISPFPPDCRRLSVHGCRYLDHPFPFSILRRHQIPFPFSSSPSRPVLPVPSFPFLPSVPRQPEGHRSLFHSGPAKQPGPSALRLLYANRVQPVPG